MISDNYRIRRINHLMFLCFGLLLTTAFILCNGSIYQSVWLGNPMFTPELADFRYTIRVENMNSVMALFVTCIPWGIMLLYFYVINSVHFDRWWHWLIMLALTCILSAWLGFHHISTECNAISPGLGAEYRALNLVLAAWNAIFAGFFFIVASFSARWWSSNCRHTPFPQ